MFRAVSIIVLLISFGAVAAHAMLAVHPWRRQWWRPVEILKKLVYLLTLFFLEQRLSLLGRLKKLVYLVALLCFVVLGVTGFYLRLVCGEELSGYLLMVHVTAGGAFAVCVAILALCRAQGNCFNRSDWPGLAGLCRGEPAASDSVWPGFGLCVKICFWLILLIALPVFMSVVLSMLPLFGTEWQGYLAETHRYSVLAFVVIAVVHTYLTIRTGCSDKAD